MQCEGWSLRYICQTKLTSKLEWKNTIQLSNTVFQTREICYTRYFLKLVYWFKQACISLLKNIKNAEKLILVLQLILFPPNIYIILLGLQPFSGSFTNIRSKVIYINMSQTLIKLFAQTGGQHCLKQVDYST